MFKKVKKLICILSVSSLLIGSYVLPSFANNSFPIDTTQHIPINRTDQQKKEYNDIITQHTKFAQIYGDIDASKATNADLEEYGIPDRPTDPQALIQWNELYGHIKKTVKPEFSTSDYSASGGWPTTLPTNVKFAGATNADIALHDGYSNYGYQLVIGELTVPSVSQPATAQDEVSFWAGFGGGTSTADPLVQDGVHCMIKNNVITYEPFWEIYSVDQGNFYYHSGMQTDLPEIPKIIPINPGDVVSFGAQLSTNGTQVAFTISNQTTGVSTGYFTVDTAIPTLTEPNPGPTVNNEEVAWVTEKNGTSLANFGTETTYGWYCFGYPGNLQTQPGLVANPFISSASNSLLGFNMVSASKVPLCTVSSQPTSSSSFTTTFNNHY